MGIHRQRSPAFGNLIREKRIQQGYTQQQVANHIKNLTQPELSHIEKQGYVPSERRLAALCEFLGLSMEEAQHHISTADFLADILEQRCTRSQEKFCHVAKQFAKKPGGANLCIIRDKPQPCDAMRSQLFTTLLGLSDNLTVSVLFTHSDAVCERSFRRFSGILHQEKTEKDRIHGYLYKPAKILPDQPPMANPLCVLVAADDYQGVTWHHTPEVLEKLSPSTPESARSLYLHCGNVDRTTEEVIHYIGFTGATEIDLNRWQKIIP